MMDGTPTLLPGERIQWRGQPEQGVRVRKSDLFVIPFSLVWGGFALFWNVTAWMADAPWFFRLFGLPFLIIGVYLIIGRFFVEAWMRGRTWYFVTNQRVIEVRGNGPPRSLDIRRLPMLALVEHGEGRGSIGFEGGASRVAESGMDGIMTTMRAALGFYRIEGARNVYQIIKRQAESA